MNTAESNSMHGTSGLSEILLGTVESPHRWHVAPEFFIRPKFVALRSESHLLNGFLVVCEASCGTRCTMWPSVSVLPASWATFPEINTLWSESPSPSCRLHLFIYFHQGLQALSSVFFPPMSGRCALSLEACHSAEHIRDNAVPKSFSPAVHYRHWRTYSNTSGKCTHFISWLGDAGINGSPLITGITSISLQYFKDQCVCAFF